MLLLAIDTATPATAVAVHDGSAVLSMRSEVDARRHAELLGPALAAVLDEAGATPRDLTHVACGVGPGPYTGLRVGVTAARVLGLAVGVPVLGVCTLDALARAALATVVGPFGVATDARRREVYWAEYDGTGARVRGPRVNRPADVAVAASVPFVGDGALRHAEAFLAAHEPRYPDAGALAGLVVGRLAAGDPLPGGSRVREDDPHGDGADALPAGSGVLLPPVPLYLRRPDAAVPGAPKRVTA